MSVRTGNVRLVPDGTGRRYSVGSTLKISIKITNEKTKVSSFAKTFTGKGHKTFDADDYLPAEESMDIAMDDLVSQMVYALTGTRVPNPSESDDEYQDKQKNTDKKENQEVDFYSQKRLYQVAYDISDEKTKKRELNAFLSFKKDFFFRGLCELLFIFFSIEFLFYCHCCHLLSGMLINKGFEG